ncbi:hypothetical protein M8C21_024480, partial [Ambrosia artemisiifolia]
MKGFRQSLSATVNLAAAITSLEVLPQVVAKYPALRFKQQLTAFSEKIYGIIRDNLIKELRSFLTLCIQIPQASKLEPRSFGKDSQPNNWQGILDCLNTHLSTLKENFVPLIVVQKVLTQIFSFINVQLFNRQVLLLYHGSCSFSNGEYIKAGLAELEQWCCLAKEEYVGSAWDELKHARQVVGLLVCTISPTCLCLIFLLHIVLLVLFPQVIHQKYRISFDEIVYHLCPILSIQQLYRICTVYVDDEYTNRSFSPDVIASIKTMLTTEDSNNATHNIFLLEDNSSIPFSDYDLSTSLQVKEFKDVKPAVELAENPDFQFLFEQ